MKLLGVLTYIDNELVFLKKKSKESFISIRILSTYHTEGLLVETKTE